MRVLIRTTITSDGRITGGRTTRSVSAVPGSGVVQLMASPIVVCLPHLTSPFFTTHRKQEAVCNPLKLEYARLSLTRTVGEEAYPKHRWTAFVPLCSVLFLLHIRIIFSFDFYILKSFLGHSDQNTFLPLLLLLLLLPHFPACVSLYFHPRAESKEKKSQGGWVWTILRLHARMASIRQKRQGGRVLFPLLL